MIFFLGRLLTINGLGAAAVTAVPDLLYELDLSW